MLYAGFMDVTNYSIGYNCLIILSYIIHVSMVQGYIYIRTGLYCYTNELHNLLMLSYEDIIVVYILEIKITKSLL